MQEILSKENIGKRIKLLRIESGHSQSYIAKILNISRSNYSQIELGNQYPAYETLNLVASYYSKTYDWLLHGTEHDAENSFLQPKKICTELPQAIVLGDGRIRQVVNFYHYVSRLNDVDYLRSLPIFGASEPAVEKSNNCRAFVADTTVSLSQIYIGDVLLGRQLQNLCDVTVDNIYIIVTLSGLLFCRIKDIIPENNLLICQTDKLTNGIITLAISAIVEIWSVIGKFSTTIQPAIQNFDKILLELGQTIGKLEAELNRLNNKFK